MLNAIAIILMPTIFFLLMSASSMLNNDILRVGGVYIGFFGMMASVINLIVNFILWVG
jgi:hypothetical protein